MILERLAPEQYDTIENVPEPAEQPLLVGHEHQRAALAAAYRTGKLPHALLFAGPQGIGKATLAYHLARHLLAHPDPAAAPQKLSDAEPDTALFRQVASGAHPAVLHLTRPVNDKGKGFKSVITVDEIRRVSRLLAMTAHDGGHRIVIVDPADDMNANAANALLKNLEEPPRRTLFVLVSHSPGRLLPTIRSRCQVMLFHPLSPDELAAAVAGAGVPIPAATAAAVAERAAGSPREAILLTHYGGLEISKALDALVGGERINLAKAHRLADAVGARDHAIQFEIFNRYVQDVISRAAGEAARNGDGWRANRLAEVWQATLAATDDALTYNLDRKQHVLGIVHTLHAAMRT
ncbi:MAG: DNA polymerase III subunit delta' [Mesorhizobium sp.]